MEKSQNITLKVFKIIGLSVFYAIIALLFLFAISTLARKKENQVPNLFGLGFLSVESDSMEGENRDSFNKGDLIFVKVLSEKERNALEADSLVDIDDPSKGKIVTYYVHGQNGYFNTHRVIGHDSYGLITQGDNVNQPDEYRIEPSQVIAIYSGKLRGVGKVVGFMQTPVGFGVVIVIPFALLLLYHGFMLVRNVFKSREHKLRDSLAAQREAEKEKLRQELLEELEEKKEDKQE